MFSGEQANARFQVGLSAFECVTSRSLSLEFLNWEDVSGTQLSGSLFRQAA